MRKSEPFGGLESITFHEERIAGPFKWWLESRILPSLKLDGYKIKEKRRLAKHCLHNLAMAELRDPPRVVADSRDNSRNGLRTAVWDSLIEAGLCRIWQKGIQGIPDLVQGGVTRYRTSKKLRSLLMQYKQRKYLDLSLDFNSQRKRPTFEAHVVLHTGRTNLFTGERLPADMQKQLIPLATLDCVQRDYLRDMERWNVLWNNMMSRHEWLIVPPNGIPYEPNFALRITHSGCPGRYVRLNGWSAIAVGHLSKAERRHLQIDGEPATELDFSAYDIRRHYHRCDIDVQGDAYKPRIVLPGFYHSSYARSRRGKEIMRKVVKKATNICLNCVTRKDAGSAVGKMLRDWPQRKRRLLWGIEQEDRFVWRMLRNVEGQGKSAGVVKRLVRHILLAHLDISHVFFNEQYPSAMMTIGAALMDNVRRRFANEDRPCYCIHDAIVCKTSDRKFAVAAMTDAYHQYVHPEFDPIIKTEF